jgi:hypothetical protein
MKGPLSVACLLGLVGLAFLAACGASTQSTHDGTTVTIEKPADSSAGAPAPAPSK